MRSLVIIGGFAPDEFEFDKDEYKCVIAADSGYDTALRLNFKPDYVVGDLDSTSYRDSLVKDGIKPCPRDKDETDTELALKLVEGEYDLLGGGEGRLDHLLSILALFHRYGYPKRWFSRSDTMLCVDGSVILMLDEGIELSIFSIFDSIEVTTEGLVWDLKKTKLTPYYLSQSNRIRQKGAMITSSGPVMLRLDPKDYFKHCMKMC